MIRNEFDLLADRDLELIRLHVEALFVHDESCRMVRVNVPEFIEPPRFFLGRTAAGVLVRFSAGLPEEIAGRLSELGETEACNLADKDPVHAMKYLEILATHSLVKGVWNEQAFAFPDVLEPAVASEVMQITQDNADLLRGGFDNWLADISKAQPFIAVVQNGRAVSLCATVRITPHAHECGIETLPDHRGRGLAGQAAAMWAVEVRKIGATPLYSTLWDNIASQRVAAKLGCRHFGSDFYVA
jgi:RimJ/RimL family protein N-acetyltransferase